jgi:uncharacterized protein YegP (UPF0339 family)
MYFDVFKNPRAQQPYYFEAKGDNNESVFKSDTYASKDSAMNAIDMLKREAADAKVFDETGEGT